jgi:hypothetical protein
MKITISAGWSGDSLYCLDDVNKLFRGIKRNTSIEHDLILYAGPEAQKPGKLHGLESGVQVIESPYPSWWVGMKGYDPDRPWIKTDSIMGLGLDCVIVGSLDDLINFPSDFVTMKDYPGKVCPSGHEKDCNMEVSVIRNNLDRPIWDEWVRLGKPTWDMLTPPEGRVWRLQAQGWINETKAIHVDLFPENWVVSYKLACRHGLPEDCRIVSFHGRPKPREVSDQWVKDNWI